jgi:hypothetical protein
MNAQHLEFELAFELIAQATERLEQYIEPEDLEAAVAAVLATSLEIAWGRPLHPFNQLFRENI